MSKILHFDNFLFNLNINHACQCLKNNGKQCTRKASQKTGQNSSFCWQHQKCLPDHIVTTTKPQLSHEQKIEKEYEDMNMDQLIDLSNDLERKDSPENRLRLKILIGVMYKRPDFDHSSYWIETATESPSWVIDTYISSLGLDQFTGEDLFVINDPEQFKKYLYMSHVDQWKNFLKHIDEYCNDEEIDEYPHLGKKCQYVKRWLESKK
jgi:hypothetical protein